MSLAYSYPKSRFETAVLVDLSSRAERERLSRSALKGFFKLADEWIHLPNTNPIFNGRTPLAYMLGGGLIAMQTVRKLLDARRGGL